jgi:hypothetical protein
MRIVTSKIDGPNPLPLGAIFGVDTYGYPRKIDMIIPPSHTLSIQSKPIKGWNFTGSKIDIDAGSGDSIIYKMDISLPDESSANNQYWMNNEVSCKLNQFIYLIAYY